MLLLTGVLITTFGLISGVALILASLGALSAEPGLTLWISFPLLCLVGFAMIAAQRQLALVRTISLASSALLLILALCSVAALVLGAAAMAPAPRSPASLWYVFIIGGALGAIGAGSFRQKLEQS